jgi:hypothetical protein
VHKEETKGGTNVKSGKSDLHREEIDWELKARGSRAERRQTRGKLGEGMNNIIAGI